MAYEIHTDVRYRPLERIEMGKLADDCTVPWWNQTARGRPTGLSC